MWEGKFWPTSGVVRIYKLSPTLLHKYFTRADNIGEILSVAENTFTRRGG